MPLYSTNVMICATAYIRADTLEEAQKIATDRFTDSNLILPDEVDADVPIFGLEYDHPEMPDVSLSPAMTLQNVCEGSFTIADED